MNKYHHLLDDAVLVLLAPGFEERETAHYISCMRESNVPVSLIGLSTQQVSGRNGLTFHPDRSLNQLPTDKTYPLVLMLGGYQYLSSLMADPRVHQLLDKTFRQDGYVAADETAESIIRYTNANALLNGRRHFITPQKRNRDEFVQHLINLVKNTPSDSTITPSRQ